MSHALTLRKHFAVTTRPAGAVPGAHKAVAVDGTPADTVMVALASPIFFDPPPAVAAAAAASAGTPAPSPPFDAVISGINRGDNAGGHVIYSGTVGAAREAALNGIPAVAVSLGDLGAEAPAAYAPAASGTAAIVAALIHEESGALARALTGAVINLNFPRVGGRAGIGAGVVTPAPSPSHSDEEGTGPDGSAASVPVRGFYLARQGGSAARPGFHEAFVEADAPAAPDGKERASPPVAAPDGTTTRYFKNVGGGMRWDNTAGTDTAALAANWASVTALTLRQDVRALADGLECRDEDGEGRAWERAAGAAVAKLVVAAGKRAGLEVAGV